MSVGVANSWLAGDDATKKWCARNFFQVLNFKTFFNPQFLHFGCLVSCEFTDRANLTNRSFVLEPDDHGHAERNE